MANLWVWALQQTFGSAIATKLSGVASTLLAANPSMTLPAFQSEADAALNGFLAVEVKQLPGGEQAFASLILSLGESSVDAWINGVVAAVYNKAVSEIAQAAPAAAASA